MKTVGLTFPPASGQVPVEPISAAPAEPEEAPADTAKAKVKK